MADGLAAESKALISEVNQIGRSLESRGEVVSEHFSEVKAFL
jgi:hypothetical protein